MNYFELFDLPVSPIIDLVALKNKYFVLSRKYHPDFFTQENEAEQDAALEKSSFINKAFKTFQNKNETLKYLLQIKSLMKEDEKYQLPQDFLFEMMEINEALMDAKMEANLSETAKIKDKIMFLEADIYQPVKTIMEAYNDEKITMEDLQKIKEYYFKKKYLERILATIE